MESNRSINKELLDDRKRLESEVKLLILGMFFFFFFNFLFYLGDFEGDFGVTVCW